MRKTGLLILLVAALIGCPPPGEDEIFNNINIAATDLPAYVVAGQLYALGITNGK